MQYLALINVNIDAFDYELQLGF